MSVALLHRLLPDRSHWHVFVPFSVFPHISDLVFSSLIKHSRMENLSVWSHYCVMLAPVHHLKLGKCSNLAGSVVFESAQWAHAFLVALKRPGVVSPRVPLHQTSNVGCRKSHALYVLLRST